MNLTSTMRELSNTIGQLQAREQELSTRLSLKVCGLHIVSSSSLNSWLVSPQLTQTMGTGASV